MAAQPREDRLDRVAIAVQSVARWPGLRKEHKAAYTALADLDGLALAVDADGRRLLTGRVEPLVRLYPRLAIAWGCHPSSVARRLAGLQRAGLLALDASCEDDGARLALWLPVQTPSRPPGALRLVRPDHPDQTTLDGLWAPSEAQAPRLARADDRPADVGTAAGVDASSRPADDRPAQPLTTDDVAEIRNRLRFDAAESNTEPQPLADRPPQSGRNAAPAIPSPRRSPPSTKYQERSALSAKLQAPNPLQGAPEPQPLADRPPAIGETAAELLANMAAHVDRLTDAQAKTDRLARRVLAVVPELRQKTLHRGRLRDSTYLARRLAELVAVEGLDDRALDRVLADVVEMRRAGHLRDPPAFLQHKYQQLKRRCQKEPPP